MVRVRYSFSSRRTGHVKNIRKQRKKYPALAKEVVNASDIVLQVLDSRFIQETRNKEIEKYILENKKILIFVLNKTDLLSKNKLDKEKLQELVPFVLVSAKTRRGSKNLRKSIKIESKRIKKRVDPEGKISIGIVGYPNTGKSSLINMLIGKHKAGTGADAGFTRGLQKLNLTENMQLLDSPGIIPESEYSNIKIDKISKHAKVGGRSYSQVKNPELVIANIIKNHRGILEKHYKINAKSNSEILLEELGKRKGFFKKKGIVNEDKTSRFILKEWQTGKIKI